MVTELITCTNNHHSLKTTEAQYDHYVICKLSDTLIGYLAVISLYIHMVKKPNSIQFTKPTANLNTATSNSGIDLDSKLI